MKRDMLWMVLIGLSVALMTPHAEALDDAHWRQAESVIDRGIAYLRTTHNDDGAWSPKPGPAVTALIVAAMLDQPDIGPDDPQVAKAIDYILARQRPDGSIHDGILANYNTSICLMALSRVNYRSDVADAIRKAQAFLKGIQWVDQDDPHGKAVDPSHPFYGGVGYGKHGRPDLSNTQLMLEALYQSGMDCDDPAFVRAMVFITRCQGTKANDLNADKIVPDGGFIYATSIDKDHIGVPQSQADPEATDEALRGRPVSGLRTYGSMTYAGFKSYLYANLSRDDRRVLDAYHWIRANYTLDRNPGLPEPHKRQGYYYYLTTFARALDAWKSSTITTLDGRPHDWANDLVDKLAALQREDGSWLNDQNRWMEGDPNLVTGYALTALNVVVR